MRYGIGVKLGLLLASFGLVAMGIVGYYSYASSRANLVAAAQRDLLTATQVLGRSFRASMNAIATDTLLLASLPASPAIAGAAPGPGTAQNTKLLADTFSAMLAVHPEYFQVRLIDVERHGLELVRVDRDGDRLVRIAAPDLQEKAHYPYVFNTLQLERGQVYLSDITINHEEGAHAGLHKPSVRVATPVMGEDGKVWGLIVVNLDLNSLFDRLKADLPNAYQLYLSNHWGDYLIHPNPAETFGFDQGRRVFIQEFFKPVATLIKGDRATVVTQVEGAQQPRNDLVAAFVRLPFGGSVEKRFVVLGLSQPLENVVREAERVGWTTIQMILVLGSLAVLLAALVSRVVTGPLRAMVNAMQLFSKDQVVSELPSFQGDEIGLLESSLNTMQNTIVANLRELNESRQALAHLAQHDNLTGLPNRALFDDRLRQALAQARRDQTCLALLFIDLDDFKSVNDTEGHHLGDLMLNVAAQRMKACVRDADTVGRLGGDEFVVLLPNVENDHGAVQVAGKICDALHQAFELDGRSLVISSSIGVAIYPEHGRDEKSLRQSADTAMYVAKQSGGNRVRLFGA